MKFYKTKFTEKFPFQYTVESAAYTIHTYTEDKWEKLKKTIEERNIIEFTMQDITKLLRADYRVIKKL